MGARPVRSPRAGWVNVWGVKAVMMLATGLIFKEEDLNREV